MTKQNDILNKIINNTAEKKYSWIPYLSNVKPFQAPELEYTQHFVPSLSYELKYGNGGFLLATFQARDFSNNNIVEEIVLYFYSSNKLETIYNTSSELYALRKIIELSLDNTYPSNLDENPLKSKDLSDDLESFLNE